MSGRDARVPYGRNRALSAITVLAMLSLMVAGIILAAPDSKAVPESNPLGSGPFGDLEWTLGDDGVLTVSGTGPLPDYAAPQDVPWNDSRALIRDIVVREGVTRIGDNAFQGCSESISVDLPDSLTSLGKGSFSGCFSLKSISLPRSVTSIPERAFDGCSSLITVALSPDLESIGANAFTGTSVRFLMIPYGCDYVPDGESRSFDEEASIIHMHRTMDDGPALVVSASIVVVSTIVCVYLVRRASNGRSRKGGNR